MQLCVSSSSSLLVLALRMVTMLEVAVVMIAYHLCGHVWQNCFTVNVSAML